jgi:hypothetical protein
MSACDSDEDEVDLLGLHRRPAADDLPVADDLPAADDRPDLFGPPTSRSLSQHHHLCERMRASKHTLAQNIITQKLQTATMALLQSTRSLKRPSSSESSSPSSTLSRQKRFCQEIELIAVQGRGTAKLTLQEELNIAYHPSIRAVDIARSLHLSDTRVVRQS